MADFGSHFGTLEEMNSSAQQTNANGASNQLFSWTDLILPGSTIVDKMFDIKGTQAAQNQYAAQLALQQQAQGFNAEEALKQRQWEEMMSNSEIQRRVKDYEAAGLNPYLAMTNGSGASAPSGSSASSTSGNADMANNKIAAAAGVIAMVLRVLFAKH